MRRIRRAALVALALLPLVACSSTAERDVYDSLAPYVVRKSNPDWPVENAKLWVVHAWGLRIGAPYPDPNKPPKPVGGER